MPSVSLLPTTNTALEKSNFNSNNNNNMTSVIRDTYQANGLIRNHIQQQQQHLNPTMSVSQTSSLLRKGIQQNSSPQFLSYTSKQQQQQQTNNQQQHPNSMQFPPAPPPMAPMIPQAATQVPKSDLSSVSSYGSQLISQQHQQQQQSNNIANNMPQQQQIFNGSSVGPNNNSSHNQAILVSPMSMPNLNNPSNQQLSHMQPQMFINQQHQQQQHQQQNHQQQLYQQYYHLQQANNSSHQQVPISVPNPNQQIIQQNNNQQQQQHPNQPHSNHQQVPMTTIMIPASAAAQIQSASAQIQQATMQAMHNSGQPQILVFMIPYMVNQQPPTVPPTPEQSNLNNTMTRQSQLYSSFRLQSQQATSQMNKQQQSQLPLNQQSQQIVVPQQVSNTRAMSSLSNSTAPTTIKVEHENFYVKANFYYQPTRNKDELAFQKGEILHILDTLLKSSDYGQYWLATKVDQTCKDVKKGLIPDRKEAEKIALEQRAHDISESNGNQDGSQATNNVLSASVGRVNFLKRRAAQRSKSLGKDNWDNVVFDIGSMKFPPYERVIYRHPGFCRPVVIFGALADFAREKLLRDYPEKYSYPCGFNQSPDHPKVIRLKGILEVIDLGKHALLDITPSAVEKLNYVNLAPIVIFMKTESKSIIKEFRTRAAQSLDMEARDDDTLRRDGKSSRKLLEQSIKLEKTWSHVFTVTLDLSMMGSEQWYRKLRETIEDQQSANVWMSDRKSDKKVSVASASNMNEMLFSVPTIQSDPSTSSCLDNGSLLSERFSESMNLTSKSTLDLVPEGTYGNRSQLRIAHAHSIAQKLARASSEPKLNGLLSDNEDDDDDDDDDDIIKKPFPAEYENSSSISSSNGATSYGHGSISGSNISYHGNYGAHQMSQQQLMQSNPAQTVSQMNNQYQRQYPLAPHQMSHVEHEQNGSPSRSHGNIYARNSSYVHGNKSKMMPDDDYHHLPPVISNGDSDYHNTQNMIPTNINSNVIDLATNHESRSSAFQVYGDINQNIYH